MGNKETPEVQVDELVVLQKFDGEINDKSTEKERRDAERERVVVHNGVIVEHSVVENGEVVGPVEDSEIVGKDVGVLFPNENDKGVAE